MDSTVTSSSSMLAGRARTLLEVDELLKTGSIKEVRELLGQAKQELKEKKSILMALIGTAYPEVLRTASAVSSIHESSKRIVETLENIKYLQRQIHTTVMALPLDQRPVDQTINAQRDNLLFNNNENLFTIRKICEWLDIPYDWFFVDNTVINSSYNQTNDNHFPDVLQIQHFTRAYLDLPRRIIKLLYLKRCLPALCVLCGIGPFLRYKLKSNPEKQLSPIHFSFDNVCHRQDLYFSSHKLLDQIIQISLECFIYPQQPIQVDSQQSHELSSLPADSFFSCHCEVCTYHLSHLSFLGTGSLIEALIALVIAKGSTPFNLLTYFLQQRHQLLETLISRPVVQQTINNVIHITDTHDATKIKPFKQCELLNICFPWSQTIHDVSHFKMISNLSYQLTCLILIYDHTVNVVKGFSHLIFTSPTGDTCTHLLHSCLVRKCYDICFPFWDSYPQHIPSPCTCYFCKRDGTPSVFHIWDNTAFLPVPIKKETGIESQHSMTETSHHNKDSQTTLKDIQSILQDFQTKWFEKIILFAQKCIDMILQRQELLIISNTNSLDKIDNWDTNFLIPPKLFLLNGFWKMIFILVTRDRLKDMNSPAGNGLLTTHQRIPLITEHLSLSEILRRGSMITNEWLSLWDIESFHTIDNDLKNESVPSIQFQRNILVDISSQFYHSFGILIQQLVKDKVSFLFKEAGTIDTENDMFHLCPKIIGTLDLMISNCLRSIYYITTNSIEWNQFNHDMNIQPEELSLTTLLNSDWETERLASAHELFPRKTLPFLSIHVVSGLFDALKEEVSVGLIEMKTQHNKDDFSHNTQQHLSIALLSIVIAKTFECVLDGKMNPHNKMTTIHHPMSLCTLKWFLQVLLFTNRDNSNTTLVSDLQTLAQSLRVLSSTELSKRWELKLKPYTHSLQSTLTQLVLCPPLPPSFSLSDALPELGHRWEKQIGDFSYWMPVAPLSTLFKLLFSSSMELTYVKQLCYGFKQNFTQIFWNSLYAELHHSLQTYLSDVVLNIYSEAFKLPATFQVNSNGLSNESIQMQSQCIQGLFDLTLFSQVLYSSQSTNRSLVLDRMLHCLHQLYLTDLVDSTLYNLSKFELFATEFLRKHIFLLSPLLCVPDDQLTESIDLTDTHGTNSIHLWKSNHLMSPSTTRLKPPVAPVIKRIPLLSSTRSWDINSPSQKTLAHHDSIHTQVYKKSSRDTNPHLTNDDSRRLSIHQNTSIPYHNPKHHPAEQTESVATATFRDMRDGILGSTSASEISSSAYRNVTNLSSFLRGHVEGLSSRVSEAMKNRGGTPNSINSIH